MSAGNLAAWNISSSDFPRNGTAAEKARFALLRLLIMLTSPSFVLPAVIDKITPVAGTRGRGHPRSDSRTSTSFISAFRCGMAP
jgi:hypothetical protein